MNDRETAPRWVVDGMNLIGSRPNRWWNDPDRAVRDMIDELSRFGDATGDEITVVFDRHPRDVEPGRHDGINVAFASRRGRNAADYEIEQIVTADDDASSLTVVTSDVRLADRVRSLGANVARTGAFRRRLERGIGQ
jgi:predicted RNA-binding protein with PIN domain